MASPDLPPLDAHAHIAPDVTGPQVRRLGAAVVFAVTRNLSEAAVVPHGCYPNLVWGLGVHPGGRIGLARWNPDRFDRLLSRFPVVGEIGLDRKAGGLDRQREVFSEILVRSADAPVLMSIHSTGAAGDVVSLLEQHRPRGPVLHWFGGTSSEIERAVAAGAWFSVNAAMRDQALSALPRERVLTETDFPHTRRAGSARPGTARPVEDRLAGIWARKPSDVRAIIWQNLAALVERAGAAERLPRQVAAVLEVA